MRPRLGVMIPTDGRVHCLTNTWRSFVEAVNVAAFDASVVVVNDCPDPGYRDVISELIEPDVLLRFQGSRRGFGGAIIDGWAALRNLEVDYVFHLEDDFMFTRYVDLGAMRAVLDANERVCQMALRRQAWNQEEKTAGGLVQLAPDAYTERITGRHEWLEHSLFFTTNPSLYRADLMGSGWPKGANSEGKFTHQLLGQERTFGYWGRKWDEPWVLHIGEHRTGTGY